jgi:hypothetical protein
MANKKISELDPVGYVSEYDSLMVLRDNQTRLVHLQYVADNIDYIYGDDTIGIPGEQGFGVGYINPSALPSGFTALEGCYDKLSNNYGNYKYSDGSIMVFIPKFYYRINHSNNPTYVTYTPNDVDIVGADVFDSREAAALIGYALHRAFIDGGVEQDGVFVDKYMCSNNGGIASSIAGGNPISTHPDHNPISGLNGITVNAYYSCIDAAKTRGDNFACTSRFIQSALALLSLAHGQASVNATYCAWYDVEDNYPKGCNNDALRDVDDTNLLYVSDGYSNCGKTGSSNSLSKTTHNGQACGVADLNGLMYEVNLGMTRPGTSPTDTSQQNDTTKFFVLKESVSLKDLTSDWGSSTSAWGDETNLLTKYDQIDIPYIDYSGVYMKFGNGSNQVISSELDNTSDGYKLSGLGFPVNGNGQSSSGTKLFGNDALYNYHRANMCLLSCFYWDNSSYAGVFACNLYFYRYPSNSYVGLRVACYPV